MDVETISVTITGDASGAVGAAKATQTATAQMATSVGAALRATDAAQERAAGNVSKFAGAVGEHTGRAGRSFSAFASGVATAVGTFAGNMLTQAANKVAEFTQKAVTDFGDLQQAVADIKTVAPQIDTTQVFKALNEMQMRVPQSAKQLSAEYYDIMSGLSLSQNDALKLVEKFGRGATGARTDVKEFGTSVMGVMNAYHLSVDKADHITDLFFNTVSGGLLRGPELAASLGPVTQNAKMAGQSIETMFAAITAGTKEGGNASENITHIADMFKDLTTAKAAKGFAELGIKLTDASGKFKQLKDVVADYQKATAGFSDEKKAGALNAIFHNVQSREGFATVVSQQKAFNEQLELNIKKTGAADAAYKVMSATFQNQSRIAANSLSAIGITIANEILPKLVPLISQFAKNLPAAMAAAKAAVGPVVAAIGDFVNRAKANFPAIKKAFNDAFEPIKPTVDDIVKWFRANFPLMQQTVGTVLNTIAEFWRAHGAQIMAVVRPLVDNVLKIVTLIMQIINGDWKHAWETAGGIVTNSRKVMEKALSLLLHFVVDLQGRQQKAAEGIGKAIIDGVSGSLKSGGHKVKTSFHDGVLKVIEDSSYEVTKAVKWLHDGINGEFEKGAQNLLKKWRKMWDDVVHYVKDIPAKIAAFLGKLPSELAKIGDTYREGGAQIGKDLWSGIVGGLKAGKDAVDKAGAEMAGAAEKGARRALDTHSPSRVMHVIGLMAAAGLQLGLEAGKAGVAKAAAATAKAIKTEFKDFDKTLAQSKANLAALMNGDDGDDAKIAGRFRHVSEARREQLSGILEQIDAIKEQRKAQQSVTDAIDESRKAIALLNAATPRAKLAIENPGATKASLDTLATLQARQTALEKNKEAQQSLREEIAKTGVEIKTLGADIYDQTALDTFGKKLSRITDATNRALVMQLARAKDLKQFREDALKDDQGITGRTPNGEVLPNITGDILAAPPLMAGEWAEQAKAQIARLTKGFVLPEERKAMNAPEKGDGANPMIDRLTQEAQRHGQKFLETLMGGGAGGRNAAFTGLLKDLQTTATSTITDLLSTAFAPQIKKLVSDIGAQLGNITQGIGQHIMQVAAQIYSLLAVIGAQGKKHQEGALIGALFGGIAALATGGAAIPFITAGASLGSFVAQPDLGGALSSAAALGGGGFYPGGGGDSAGGQVWTGGAGGGWSESAGRAVNVNVNQYGAVNNLGGLEHLTGAMTDAVQTGLRTAN